MGVRRYIFYTAAAMYLATAGCRESEVLVHDLHIAEGYDVMLKRQGENCEITIGTVDDSGSFLPTTGTVTAHDIGCDGLVERYGQKKVRVGDRLNWICTNERLSNIATKVLQDF